MESYNCKIGSGGWHVQLGHFTKTLDLIFTWSSFYKSNVPEKRQHIILFAARMHLLKQTVSAYAVTKRPFKNLPF
jgi:hypothetical protein